MNLDALFTIVAEQADTLVVLLTQSTLSRTWCAGEIATASQKKILQTVVRHEEFVNSTDVKAQFKTILDYDTYCGDLRKHDIGKHDVVDA